MKRILLLAGVLVIVGFGVWWYFGGQYWWAVQTGTDYCVNVPPKLVPVCQHYGFWSGFGSVIPWALLSAGGLLGGLALAFRHTNCHVKGCPRIGRFALAGGDFKICGHHHPGFDGKHPTLEHMTERWRQHWNQVELLTEIHRHVSGQPGKFPPEETLDGTQSQTLG